jgi:hypothetical protein
MKTLIAALLLSLSLGCVHRVDQLQQAYDEGKLTTFEYQYLKMMRDWRHADNQRLLMEMLRK